MHKVLRVLSIILFVVLSLVLLVICSSQLGFLNVYYKKYICFYSISMMKTKCYAYFKIQIKVYIYKLLECYIFLCSQFLFLTIVIVPRIGNKFKLKKILFTKRLIYLLS